MTQLTSPLAPDEVTRGGAEVLPSFPLSLATICIAALVGCSTPAPRDWNVLLITIDTLRADHLSCYGYERSTSPTIDRLAADGVLFEQTIAQRSQTWPSMASIMTSLYPHEHGVRRNGQLLEKPVNTLAEVMRNHGYQTAASLTNMRNQRHPGFDEVFLFKGDDRDVEATRATVDWLKELGDGKFFFWIHYIAPHKPYRPPAAFADRFGEAYTGEVDGETSTLDRIILDETDLSGEDLAHIIALYDGEIAFVDDQVRQVLATLREAGLAERTLIVVASDHGEELFQRNHYFYHSASIYDSVLRIPWIVRFPDSGPSRGARRVETVVQSIDIAPTIVDLLGLPIPGAFQGRSHSSVILGGKGSQAEDPAAFSELPWGVLSIRTARWRYISNPHGRFSRERPYSLVEDARRDGYSIGREELFDLQIDPGELHDLFMAGSDDRSASGLKVRLEDWAAGWSADLEDLKTDPAIEEELRALGYIE